jgi:hypothetical protein
MQKSVLSVFDSYQDNTLRVFQSMIAIRYTKSRAIGIVDYVSDIKPFGQLDDGCLSFHRLQGHFGFEPR